MINQYECCNFVSLIFNVKKEDTIMVQEVKSVALDFDPNAFEELQDREPMETHWNAVEIIESEMKETGGGTGAMLALTVKILPGYPNAGRLGWINLNIQNSNEMAVEIASRALTTIAKCCGIQIFYKCILKFRQPFCQGV